MDIEKLKYPIGKFIEPESYDDSSIKKWIEEIATLPMLVRTELNDITEEQLNSCYRPDSWKLYQVIHHISDSHMNGYMRLKWILTEDNTTIKLYNQDRFANLSDNEILTIKDSVDFLELLHKKFAILLKTLNPLEMEKEYIHPESDKPLKLKRNIALYAWHGKHHLAHIKIIKGTF